MNTNKKILAGLVALAAAGTANAAIVVGGDNGYEFSVDGNINQFFVYTDQKDLKKDPTVAGSNDQSETTRMRNGLLPTFFGFNVKAPTMNGLDIGARVSISPSTNGGSYTAGGQDGNAMEQREAFATISGSFGTILAGKALGLYGSHNILTDQTLYGVGATGIVSNGDGTTTLGRIGYGYDYANWRSQFKWTSVDMSGFQVALAIMDGEQVNASDNRSDPRYEADLTYAGTFDGGSFSGWLSGMAQRVEPTAGSDIKSHAYTAGATLNFSGFEAMVSYYDNTGVGDIGGLVFSSGVDAGNHERDGDGFIVQGGYNFGGTTRLIASYGESNLDKTSFEKNDAAYLADTATAAGGVVDSRSMTTVGVYHDVNSNLKLVAEYSMMEDEFHTARKDHDTDVFAIGGFVTW